MARMASCGIPDTTFRFDLTPVQRVRWHKRSKLALDLVYARPILADQPKCTGSRVDGLIREAFQHVKQRDATTALLSQRERFVQRTQRRGREVNRAQDVVERRRDVCVATAASFETVSVGDATARATSVARTPDDQNRLPRRPF